MKNFSRLFADWRLLVAIGMGFSSGLPLLLSASTVQLWYKEAGIGIETIGILSMVGIAYTFKVLWAPLLDWVAPPFLGRRRGWLFLSQIGLVLSLAGMALSNPVVSPLTLAGFALLVATISATQDIGIDAFLVETFPPENYALGVQCYVQAYRIGMLVASGGALLLADRFGWRVAYLSMAACMLVGLVTTLLSPEPKSYGQPRTFTDAVVLPLKEFLTRRNALLILAFLVLYNFGGNMATALTNLFYSDLGYTKTQIGVTAKTWGLGATIVGGMIGAAAVYSLGIFRSLWIFGIVQALGFLSFAWLDRYVHASGQASGWALAVAIIADNLGIGLATAAYTAFMGSIVDRRFSATQYALFTSLMALPRSLGGGIAGKVVPHTGWFSFYFLCVGVAIPGLLLLLWLGKVHFGRTETSTAGAGGALAQT